VGARSLCSPATNNELDRSSCSSLRAGPIPGPATLDQEHIPCRSIAYYEVPYAFLRVEAHWSTCSLSDEQMFRNHTSLVDKFSCWVLDCQSLIAGRMKR
jgi:hypothetical protein